jgi:hypothetical protein
MTQAEWLVAQRVAFEAAEIRRWNGFMGSGDEQPDYKRHDWLQWLTDHPMPPREQEPSHDQA